MVVVKPGSHTAALGWPETHCAARAYRHEPLRSVYVLSPIQGSPILICLKFLSKRIFLLLVFRDRSKEFLRTHSHHSKGLHPLPLPLQGRVGICSVWATMVEAILSPRAHMASLGGPEIAGRENGTGSAIDRQSIDRVHGMVARLGRAKRWREALCLLSLSRGPFCSFQHLDLDLIRVKTELSGRCKTHFGRHQASSGRRHTEGSKSQPVCGTVSRPYMTGLDRLCAYQIV